MTDRPLTLERCPACGGPLDAPPRGRMKADDRNRLEGFRVVPKRTSSLHLRIDTRALARWRSAAEERRVSVSELVRSVMDRFLNAGEFKK